MIMIEDMDTKTKESLVGFIRILKRSMHEESFHRDPEQKYFRHFFWWPRNNLSENDLNPITFFLSFLDIYLNKKYGSKFHFRHNKKRIHVNVKEEGDKFRINAHIEIRHPTVVLYNNFTTKLLSSLSIFLQMINKQSHITFFSPKYSKTNESEESKHEQNDKVNHLNSEGEIINIDHQEQNDIQVVNVEGNSHESLKEERIKKSKESIYRTLKAYQLKKNKIFERKILKELERREKEQKNAWGRESQHIIEIVFEQETNRLLSDKKFILNSKLIKNKIKLLLNAYLEELEQETHGRFRSEFRKVCHNFFPEIFREKQKLLNQERTNTWVTISTQIIEKGFEDIFNNYFSECKFKLDRESVRLNINYLGSEYYSKLNKDHKPFFFFQPCEKIM